jgi:hypothetical protein
MTERVKPLGRVYEYIGPEVLRADAKAGIPKCRLRDCPDLAALVRTLELAEPNSDEVTLTYVVDAGGVLWIADRHSEHVACARGRGVLAAGELTVTPGRPGLKVIEATNQSTGYCPEPGSWEALAKALDSEGIPGPSRFEHVFVFRRCTACGATAIVKDEFFECAECGDALSADWNFGPAE